MSTPRFHRAARRLRGAGGMIAIATLVLGGATTGCEASHDPSNASTAAATSNAMPPASGGGHPASALGPAMTDAQMAATWQGRPAFVTQNGAEVEAAYAYALERPDVIQWMPCYCGCAAMDHRSNLDCFFKPRSAGMPVAYEEHASYCDVCVKTALTAKRLLGQGMSLREIRAVVDAQFGSGSAPGTQTELPPA